MHKSWGNSIEFNEAADKMGVDVMRWLYCSHRPEKDLLFGYKVADEIRRLFLLPLWNVYSFFTTYASIDGWKPDSSVQVEYKLLDRWILSRLNPGSVRPVGFVIPGESRALSQISVEPHRN